MFASLDDEQLGKIANHARVECAIANVLIVAAGEPADNLRCVVDGRVQISITAPGHDAHPTATVSAGEVLGWSSLLPQSRWLANATALKNTTIIVVESDALHELCDSDPEIGYQVMRGAFETVSMRLHDTWLQLIDSYSQ